MRTVASNEQHRPTLAAWRRRRRNSLPGVAVVALLVLSALGWLVSGCGVSIGVTKTLTIEEPLGSAAVTDLEVSMGSGKLTVAPGAVGLASGTVRYNVETWVPNLTRSDGKLSIKQANRKSPIGLVADIVNEWNLELGKAPMRLRVTAGSYDGAYDLSGLTLQYLSIKDGAARSQVMFNSPNPGQMSELVYETGASAVELIGLANANFKSMTFTGGAGSYSLDFGGQLRTSADVKIEAGAGSVRLKIPGTTAAEVTIYGSLNNVSAQGTWTHEDRVYSTLAAASGEGKKLSITLKINVGTVNLVAE
jgi:hypothetical protein